MGDEVEAIARKLGAAQRRTVLSLSGEWGKAACHQAAKRLWWRTDIPFLVQHKHCADNIWRLTNHGLAIRRHLEGVAP